MSDIQELLSALSNPIIAAAAVYIAKSLHDLNVKIAVVVERVDAHEKRITHLEEC